LVFTIRKPGRVGFLIFPRSHSDSSKDKTFQRSEQKKKRVAGLMSIVQDRQYTNKLKYSYIIILLFL
jgi:hypothetical protein